MEGAAGGVGAIGGAIPLQLDFLAGEKEFRLSPVGRAGRLSGRFGIDRGSWFPSDDGLLRAQEVRRADKYMNAGLGVL